MTGMRTKMTNRVIGGNMKKPFRNNPEELNLLDGDYTYVDNEALLCRIVGTWSDETGRFLLTLDGDCHMVLTMEERTILETELSFTYLQPGAPRQTELWPDNPRLSDGAEESIGRVMDFYYLPSETDRLVMTIVYDLPDREDKEQAGEGSREKLVFSMGNNRKNE